MMLRPQVFALLSVSTLFSSVAAHGKVAQVKFDSTVYTSPSIGNTKEETGPFFVVSNNLPVESLTSADVTCGASPRLHSSVKPIPAGSDITFVWDSGYSKPAAWPHYKGPMFLYLAKSEDGKTCDPTASTEWVKVWEADWDTSTNQWAQMTVHDSGTVTAHIPASIEPGVYTFRHEIINLARVDAESGYAGPELYPNCQCFEITGEGKVGLDGGKKATFPGGYTFDNGVFALSGTQVHGVKGKDDIPATNPELYDIDAVAVRR